MERLEDKSIYDVVGEVSWEAGVASLGISPVGFDASFDDGLILHYDLAGRLHRAATPNVQWRRGLSQQTLRVQKRPAESGGGLQIERIGATAAEDVVRNASSRLVAVARQLAQGQAKLLRHPTAENEALAELERMVRLTANYDVAAAGGDRDRFAALYGRVPILPPDQYGAVVLLATDGCVFNRCTFCSFYRETEYRMRSVSEFRQHIESALAFHGEGLRSRRGVFLGQANALAGPTDWREEILRTVNETFEFPSGERPAGKSPWWLGSPSRMESIASFVDAFTGVNIDAEEYARLRELHLRRLYVGVETGAPTLLNWLNKPATRERMQQAVANAKLGGLQVGVIILLGAGGERFFGAHVEQTISLLQSLPLTRGDFVYLSRLVEESGSDYARKAEQDGIEPLTPQRLAEQERLLRDGLSWGSQRNRPYVARYDVSHFVY
jgi:hypothetical protein